MIFQYFQGAKHHSNIFISFSDNSMSFYYYPQFTDEETPHELSDFPQVTQMRNGEAPKDLNSAMFNAWAKLITSAYYYRRCLEYLAYRRNAYVRAVSSNI